MDKEKQSVMALIPARSGSKGIRHKNISLFQDKPLLAHSIVVAREAQRVDRVLVSTDSQHYADIAASFGAETPFLRPAEIAQDLSTDLEAFRHALMWLQENEGSIPDICVHLRPTYPRRDPVDVDRAIELLVESGADSVRSVVAAAETPYKMWFMDDDGYLNPAVTSDIHEPYNMPRQSLPQAYIQQANIDVVWSRVILEQESMTGTRIRALMLESFEDIDTQAQFVRSALMSFLEGSKRGRFVFDIDGVIATITPDNDYSQAEPIPETVEVINHLYEQGHTIILNTARGTMTGIDWREVTEDQMARWNVQHHELRLGKPAGDFYIDDKNATISELLTEYTRYIKRQDNR